MGTTTMTKMAWLAVLAAAILCAWKPPAGLTAETPAPAKPTWTKLEPADGTSISERVPVTFCVFFRPGEIAGQKQIAVVTGGREVPAQVDVKRTFDDGSGR